MTLLSHLLARYRNRHDPALAALADKFGTKPALGDTYDYAKAQASFQKAQRQTASGRTYRRSKPKVAAKVLPMKVAK